MDSRKSRNPTQPAVRDATVHEPILSSRTGWLVGLDPTGTLLVDFEGNTAGPVSARLAIAPDPQALKTALSARGQVVLLFDKGDPRQPIIIGLLQEPSPTPLLDVLLEQHPPPAQPPLEAWVDGKRVVIQGKEEIVLVCGESSITLRRDGRIVVRGRSVETRATGVNRVKGGAVEIN